MRRSFFRDKRDCFKWNTIARLFQKPESNVRGWVNPRGKEDPDEHPSSPGMINCIALTASSPLGKRNAHANGSSTANTKAMPEFTEVREFVSSLRNEWTYSDVEGSRHWSAGFKDRHSDLGVELLAAMETARYDVPAPSFSGIRLVILMGLLSNRR
jgi:hypothetical protein